MHGSIALEAFCPKSGDIDILIVVKKSLDQKMKLSIAEEIIKIDGNPCPLEMSAILEKDAKEWKTPGNCVFHYSDFWTARYKEKFVDPQADCYIVDNEFPDADVTSYIKLIRQSGIVLYGRKIEEVFGDISDTKYIPKRAMKIWFEEEQHELPEDDLEKLRIYLITEIQKT